MTADVSDIHLWVRALNAFLIHHHQLGSYNEY